MNTVISYIIGSVLAIMVIWFVIKKNERKSGEIDPSKLADIGPDCRHSEEYKCADEILRDMFFSNPYEIAKEMQHIGTFYSLWESIRKYYYRQYKTNRIISIKAKNIVIETKFCAKQIFIAIHIPIPMSLHRNKPRSDILPEDEYFVGLIIPDDMARPIYVTLKREKKGKIVTIWTNSTTSTIYDKNCDFKMDSFGKILLTIGKTEVNSWDQCSNTYEGQPWMIRLWGWADNNNISIFTLPRNEEKLLELEELNLSFSRLKNLPKEIGNLRNLKKLSLTSCELTSLPVEISKLTKLKELSIVGNGIEYLPDEFCLFENLELLDARMTSLKQLPLCMRSLHSLRILTNEDNKFNSRYN